MNKNNTEAPNWVLYEDNHLIAVNKKAGQLTQGDKTGDTILPDLVKAYLKSARNKPGNVFLGVIHRLDRPATGTVLFACTSKALSRMALQFKQRQTEKVYWIVVEGLHPEAAGTAIHYLQKNEKQNKSFVTDKGRSNAKEAKLHYKALACSDRYTLMEIILETGRHHQIRVQMSHLGFIIKGDVKYGARRSNPDGSIHLHARRLQFIHPVSEAPVAITAPCPEDPVWRAFEQMEIA
jgi:23S rRNA pseudouridine1911/1915/1917 synthase